MQSASIALRRLANVSETMAACRVATLAGDLGLVNGAVAAFDDKNVLMWTWAPVLRVPERTALGLLKHADQAAPNPYRYKQNDNNVVVASVLPAGTIRVLS